MPSCHQKCAVPRALVQPAIVRPILPIMQWARVELLPRSHDLPVMAHVSFPTSRPVFSLVEFRVRSAGCSTEASIMQLSCKLSSATATQAEIGPSRHRSAQIKVYSAYHRLHSARELTEILPSTRNSAAQPGKCQANASHVVVRHFFDWPGRTA